MFRGVFKIIKVEDIDLYLNIEDESMLCMSANKKTLEIYRNNPKDLFSLKSDRIMLICCGSHKLCSIVRQYLLKIAFRLYDTDCNSDIYIPVFDVGKTALISIPYNDFSFCFSNIKGYFEIDGLQTPLDTVVEDLLSNYILLKKDFRYAIELCVGDTVEWEMQGNVVRLYGNPVLALYNFMTTELGLVDSGQLKIDYHLNSLRALGVMDDNNIVMPWAYIDLVDSMLVMQDRESDVVRTEELKIPMSETNLFQSKIMSIMENKNK